MVDAVARPYKILVVDDEEDVMPMFKQRLRRDVRQGKYELLFAANGIEAVAVLEDVPDIDILITDINMPELDGLGLLEQISGVHVNLRALVLSAYGNMDNIRKAMNRGAFDFVLKPVDFDDIRVTLERSINDLERWRIVSKARDELLTIQKELDIAARIQKAVIPKKFPAFDGFDVSAIIDPARSVAGDFYDVIQMNDGLMGLVVADVSGKGVPASLMMMSSRTLLHGASLRDNDPGLVMESANEDLCIDNDLFMFVTVFLGVYDPTNGHLRYANAGHPSPGFMSCWRAELIFCCLLRMLYWGLFLGKPFKSWTWIWNRAIWCSDLLTVLPRR